jgi:hypothetical protein
MVVGNAATVMADTWARAGVFGVTLHLDLPGIEASIRRLSGRPGATGFAASVNRIIHQSFTDLWRQKWEPEFERRWYSRVQRRTGLSGQSFALARGTSAGTTWTYSISSATDYAEHVHPSGRDKPLFALEVKIWTQLYARDVEKEIAKRLRTAWVEEVRQAVRAALARRESERQVLRSVVGGKLRALIAARAGR